MGWFLIACAVVMTVHAALRQLAGGLRSLPVVVPLHDHAAVVAETLDSILDHDHEPLEPVVVDDGSRDGGGDVAAGYEPRVRLVRQPQMGASNARNRGLTETSGGLVVFFDADDVMPAGRLGRQAAALVEHPELDGVFGDVVEFRDGTPPWRSEPRPGRLPGSMMLRRGALERAGGFREGGAQVEALEWAARADDAGLKLKHLPGVTMERRLHPGNHSLATNPQEYLRVLKVILDRRGGPGGLPSSDGRQHRVGGPHPGADQTLRGSGGA